MLAILCLSLIRTHHTRRFDLHPYWATPAAPIGMRLAVGCPMVIHRPAHSSCGWIRVSFLSALRFRWATVAAEYSQGSEWRQAPPFTSYIEGQQGEKQVSAIGNVLWFVFGGFYMGLGWWLAGLLCAITIVGLPWAKSCFVIGQFTFLPFCREAISRADLDGVEDIGTGALGMIGNVIWFLAAGMWLAVGHVITAIGCFITVIGIPFGIQHLKLAVLALAPVGKTIVTKDQAASAKLYAAQMRATRKRPF